MNFTMKYIFGITAVVAVVAFFIADKGDGMKERMERMGKAALVGLGVAVALVGLSRGCSGGGDPDYDPSEHVRGRP